MKTITVAVLSLSALFLLIKAPTLINQSTNSTEVIVSLPEKLERAKLAQATRLASEKDDDIRKALTALVTDLKEDAIQVQSLTTGRSRSVVRAEIDQDLNALARTVRYEQGAADWTHENQDIYTMNQQYYHLLNLVEYHVTAHAQKNGGLDLAAWKEKWYRASDASNSSGEVEALQSVAEVH